MATSPGPSFVAISYLLAFAALAAACAPASSAPAPGIDLEPFLGRYSRGSEYVSDQLEIRPDGRFHAWGSSCLTKWAYSGHWRIDTPRCITLEEDSPVPCVMESGLRAIDPETCRCCRDPVACGHALHRSQICLGAPGKLQQNHGGGDVTEFAIVQGHPAAVPTDSDSGAYAYKVPTSCHRAGSYVQCWCTRNGDVALLDDDALKGTLALVAAEPLDLRALRTGRLEELMIVDPSLTSLADLPASPTLLHLEVSAPLRELGNMRRFPALERLTLEHTHLTSLRELAGLKVRELHVASFHRLDSTPPAAQTPLKTLFVGLARWDVADPRTGKYTCAHFDSGAVDRCGWSRQCANSGLCTASRGGACLAGIDADCEQSVACTEESRCTARGGACVAK